jgi:hypothetical protein
VGVYWGPALRADGGRRDLRVQPVRRGRPYQPHQGSHHGQEQGKRGAKGSKFLQGSKILFRRVADPDPDSIGSVDPDPDPDPGGQK